MTTDVQLNHEIPVRTAAPHPLGSPGVSGTRMAELGAKAGAVGLENGAVTKLANRMQTAAYEAALDNVEALLDDVMVVVGARLNRLLQDVRALPEQAMAQPQGVIGTLLGAPRVQPTVSLVTRDQVLQLISQAMVEKPTR
jgi:hypothetical protein